MKLDHLRLDRILWIPEIARRILGPGPSVRHYMNLMPQMAESGRQFMSERAHTPFHRWVFASD
jgi:hypothetical protein